MESSIKKDGKPDLKEIKKIAKETGNLDLANDVNKRIKNQEKLK